MIPSEARHALRTPLNQIIGYVDLVTEDATDMGAQGLLSDLARIKAAALDLLGQLEGLAPSALVRPTETPKEDDGLGFLQAYAPPEEKEEGRILVVDDAAANRDLLVRLLEKRGYTVAQAGDGAEALRMLHEAEEPYELVLLDILMPEVNGWETLQRLKADERLGETPVIMISGLDETDAVVRCLELGAEDFVQKPFVAAILKARVSAVLGHKRTRDREIALYQRLQESYRELREFMASEEASI